MAVGTFISVGRSLDSAFRRVERAEALGYESVYVTHIAARDSLTTLVAYASRTERVRLGTGVMPIYSRKPVTTAMSAATADEFSGGRLVLGLGVSHRPVVEGWFDDTIDKPVSEMREYVGIVRAILRGEDPPQGETFKTGFRFMGFEAPRPDLPIYVAGLSPGMLRLAGEIADGAILLSGVAPGPLAAATDRVREGARAAGRERVPMTVSAFCRVTDDVPRAARELKPICARIAQNGGAPFLALAGVHVEVPGHLPGVYPDLVHAEDWDAAVRACDPYVPDDAASAFAREFCLYGTAAEIADRLASVRAAGADAVFLQHVGSYDLPVALLADIAEHVLPLIRARVPAR